MSQLAAALAGYSRGAAASGLRNTVETLEALAAAITVSQRGSSPASIIQQGSGPVTAPADVTASRSAAAVDMGSVSPRHREVVEEIIDFLEIQDIRKKAVGTLAYGLQKRVELGRALALDPQVLLLDEPMAGMNAEETEDMARFILDINEERDVTVVLIEHDMGVVMDISDRICTLDFGERISMGKPEEIQADPKVVAAYLGEEEH